MEHNKLKLEDCCLTVEQAKELKVLGIDMDNPLFEYIQLVSDKQYIEEPIEKRVLGKPFLYNNTLSTLVVGGNEMYELITPTLTNSEMLEMLPKEITPMEDGYLMPYSLFYDGHSLGYIEWWGEEKGRYKINILEDGDYPNEEEIYLKKWNLRDALFEIIKWLKTNKLM